MRSHLIKPELGKAYPLIDYGKGIYLYDATGKRYVDGCSGAVSANIGHGITEIIEKMAEQANRVSFAYRAQFTSEPAEALAAKLAEWAPDRLNWSFFVNSGSEATETAQKMAIQYWQEKGFARKTRIISRWMSYHGITQGALSMSGHVLRRKRFVPILNDYPAVSAPYPYRRPAGMSLEEYAVSCANELEQALLRIGPEHVAAFIAEPVIGAAGGAVVPPDGYFQRIREICDQYDILLIADEVMTGLGRTGKKFAVEHWGIHPDLIALGKGMGAGYTPIAAVLASDDIVGTIAAGSGVIMGGHTYSANPQSTATALAVLQYMEQHDLVSQAAANGRYLLERLQQLAAKYPLIGEARGLGLLTGLEFVKNRPTKEPFALSLGIGQRVLEAAFRRGLLIYPAFGGLDGMAGDAVIVAPPLIITPEQIDEMIGLLDAAIAEVQEQVNAGVLASESGGRV
ncbi:aspartate aminotransferase family protein [Brevibacillus fulvus]|uniref:Adenosylmethionine-8-amino-7-oxononanoate aminotransferase n=1 Tax=Brevibacillus fulvus TaxID=1125967 RepID=A0A939BQF4_9BACL|nr:aspartate aminotransferase family protein [Brevibacillus fulvus]MBM7588422.1 adenosylmethionine-8-amino-7-oxononanoate aminotransferase [Brevibacillus fulvus]